MAESVSHESAVRRETHAAGVLIYPAPNCSVCPYGSTCCELPTDATALVAHATNAHVTPRGGLRMSPPELVKRTGIVREARTGKGMLGTLLGNQDVARDLQALISNLRAHGVLFYRDSAAREQARGAQPQTTAAPRRQGSRP